MPPTAIADKCSFMEAEYHKLEKSSKKEYLKSWIQSTKVIAPALKTRRRRYAEPHDPLKPTARWRRLRFRPTDVPSENRWSTLQHSKQFFSILLQTKLQPWRIRLRQEWDHQHDCPGNRLFPWYLAPTALSNKEKYYMEHLWVRTFTCVGCHQAIWNISEKPLLHSIHRSPPSDLYCLPIIRQVRS